MSNSRGDSNDSSLFHRPRLKWWTAIIFTTATLVFGCVGVLSYHKYEVLYPLDFLYVPLQMLILHTPELHKPTNICLEIGRWTGAAALTFTAISFYSDFLRQELMLTVIGFRRGHQVIFGLSHQGLEIAMHFRNSKNSEKKADNNGKRVVVIDPEPDILLLAEAVREGIVVLREDPTAKDTLNRAYVKRAAQVIVVTPEDETNLSLAISTRQYLGAQHHLPFHIQLKDSYLREELQFRKLQLEQTSSPPAENISKPDKNARFHFFNVYDNEARRILLALPIDGRGIGKDDPRSVHIVILGFDAMAQCLALRAAKMGQFANGRPLRLSIIEHKTCAEMERFLFRYPNLNKACDFRVLRCHTESLAVRTKIEEWAAEKDTLLHVFICLDDDIRTMDVAFRLQYIVKKHPHSHLLARIHSEKPIARLISGDWKESDTHLETGEKILTFGMVDEKAFEAMDGENRPNEKLACQIHKQFVAQRQQDSSRNQINDPAMEDWDYLREDFRESNRQQADHILIKLRAIGCQFISPKLESNRVREFKPEDIQTLARMEHRRFNAERWLAGWVYEEKSDKDNRISQHLVDWDNLPQSIRAYDENAVQQILQLANSMNQIVVPLDPH